MAIIAILIGLLLPAVQKIRETANRMKCSNNLRQVGLAVHNYEVTLTKVPAAWTPDTGNGTYGSNTGMPGGNPQATPPVVGTIHFSLLPYVEQENLYQKSAVVPSGSTYAQYNSSTAQVYNTVLQVYVCPSDATNTTNIQRYNYASTTYAANLMVFDPRGPGSATQAMPGGLSNTVMFAERYKICNNGSGITDPAWAMHPAFVNHGWDTPVFGWRDYTIYNGVYPQGAGQSTYDPSFDGGVGIPFQVRPQPQKCDWHVTQSGHTGVMNVLMGDGSVRGVSTSVSLPTWVIACYPKSGQPLGSDW
jgi:prepilin-type processing-associated H-X9-DG protein